MKLKRDAVTKGVSPALVLPDLPQELLSALLEGLADKANAFADGLNINLAETPIRADKPVGAGLNKSTEGLTLDPAALLDGPLQLLYQTLVGSLALLPIEVAFKWTIDEGPLSGRLLGPQQQARAVDGITNPTFVLAVLPQLIEHTKAAPTSAPFTIGVELTLSVRVLGGEIAAPPIALNLPIAVPTLPIPALLGLFRHPGFAVTRNGRPGFLLLVVAADSPLNTAGPAIQSVFTQISEVADTLDGAIGLVSTIAGFVLPDGLDDLVVALRAVAAFGVDGTAVTLENPIENLNRIKLIDNPIFKLNDIEGENETSSLILIGGNATTAELFRRRQLRSDGGKLVVTTGPALHTRISNLHAKEPAGAPDDDRAVVPNPGAVDWELWSNKHFGDSISSLRVTFR